MRVKVNPRLVPEFEEWLRELGYADGTIRNYIRGLFITDETAEKYKSQRKLRNTAYRHYERFLREKGYLKD